MKGWRRAGCVADTYVQNWQFDTGTPGNRQFIRTNCQFCTQHLRGNAVDGLDESRMEYVLQTDVVRPLGTSGRW